MIYSMQEMTQPSFAKLANELSIDKLNNLCEFGGNCLSKGSADQFTFPVKLARLS